jgi:hypothetical protein
VFSREAAIVSSQGRKPLENGPKRPRSPGGAIEALPPLRGLKRAFPRLPGAYAPGYFLSSLWDYAGRTYQRPAFTPRSLTLVHMPVSSNEPRPTWPQRNVLSVVVRRGFVMSSK